MTSITIFSYIFILVIVFFSMFYVGTKCNLLPFAESFKIVCVCLYAYLCPWASWLSHVIHLCILFKTSLVPMNSGSHGNLFPLLYLSVSPFYLSVPLFFIFPQRNVSGYSVVVWEVFQYLEFVILLTSDILGGFPYGPTGVSLLRHSLFISWSFYCVGNCMVCLLA